MNVLLAHLTLARVYAQVKLVFHADNFTEGTYLSFFSRTELTRALHKRYGKQPELYPGGRRGDPVSMCNVYVRE